MQARCQSLLARLVGEEGCGDCGVAAVEPGLSEVVMKVVMTASPGHQTLDQLLQLLEVPQERNRVLHSLGYSKNMDVLSRQVF